MGVKNCPETPRQKMINMMYLVLTAMLALNIAAETLNAFKVVDLSLVKTYKSFTDENKSVIKDFEWEIENGQSPDSARYYLKMASDIHALSDSLANYILDIKTQMALQVNSEKLLPGETLPSDYPFLVTKNLDTLILRSHDDLNVSSNIMIERGKGEELKNRIIEFREKLLSYVKGNKILESNIRNGLDVSDPNVIDKTSGAKTWVLSNFYMTPLIASMTILSKLQNDVRIAEDVLLKYLYSKIALNTQKVRGFEAKVIPKSTYVIAQNQKFEAKIFLAAKTDIPIQVYMNGSNTPLPVEGSEAIYTASPSEPRNYTYAGEIRYTDPLGNLTSAPFNGEYEVAAPSATVSPSKMNVLYRGIDNPIEISVPGISRSQIRAVTNNGSIITKNDSLFVIPTEQRLTTIDVYAKFGNSESKMGFKVFRVKEVPPPILGWGSFKSGGQILKGFETNHHEILVYKPSDFDYDLQYVVTSFTVAVQASGGNTNREQSSSNMLTPKQLLLIGTLNRGDKVFFESIKAMVRGTVVNDIPLPPAYFNIY
jgi:gliding motility-associated protein GldM